MVPSAAKACGVNVCVAPVFSRGGEGAMAHKIFDLISIVMLTGWLLRAVRSFLVSDFVCVLGECVAAEWRRVAARRNRSRPTQKKAAVASINSPAWRGLEFSGD